jgi:general secretion pathway protein L
MFEKRSLGIAFEADGTVRAVELVSSVRAVTLSRVWIFEPGDTDRFDSWKLAVDQLRNSEAELDNVVIGLPDSYIYRKHLGFPFKNRKRIMQILNSALDGEIPLRIDDVVADFVPGLSEGSGLLVTAMACDKTTLVRFLDIVESVNRLKGVQTGSVGLATSSIRAGIQEGVTVRCSSLEAVLIEFRSSRVKSIKRMSLTGNEKKDTDLLVDGIRQHTIAGDEVILGCGEYSAGIKSALNEEGTLNLRSMSDLDIVQKASGLDADAAEIAPAVGLALSGLGTAEALPFDLRQGPFKQVTQLTGLKGPILRTSALLLLVGIMGLAALITSYHQTRGEYESLQSQLETEFTELLPGSRHQPGQEAGDIKGKLDDLKRKMADLSGLQGRGALSVMAALSAAIPDDVSLKLDELSYDSTKLRFEGSVSSFDAVDRIKAALDSDPLFADVQVQNARVGADLNKVTFRLQMEVR